MYKQDYEYYSNTQQHQSVIFKSWYMCTYSEFNLISQIPHVKCDSLKTLVLRSNNIIAMSGL